MNTENLKTFSSNCLWSSLKVERSVVCWRASQQMRVSTWERTAAFQMRTRRGRFHLTADFLQVSRVLHNVLYCLTIPFKYDQITDVASPGLHPIKDVYLIIFHSDIYSDMFGMYFEMFCLLQLCQTVCLAERC